MRKLAFLSGLILITAMAASAQEKPSREVFLGYSYIRANPSTSGAPNFNLNGGTGSAAIYPWRWLGFVGDFGGYHVGDIGGTNVNGNVFTYLFGPRVYLPGTHRLRPFGELLLGGAHTTGTSLGAGSRNAFAMGVGGGLDVHATRHLGWRVAEIDYLPTWFPEAAGGNRLAQHNLRISTGIRFRF